MMMQLDGKMPKDKKPLVKVRNIETIDVDNLTKAMVNDMLPESAVNYFQE